MQQQNTILSLQLPFSDREQNTNRRISLTSSFSSQSCVNSSHETDAINKIVLLGVLDNGNDAEWFEALAGDWYFIEEIITLFES
ncbi:unnamed protein product [Lactuca virosa]|uniref:Uncharacterized protein n=1 Tax=Lactuca virosa TaxID=75947 RepID=A0AAU9LCY1_9ASTR|nr:unnamed protein product [Lactuca virosa]